MGVNEIGSLSSSSLLDKAALRTPDMSTLAEQFSRLMADQPQRVQDVVSANTGAPSVVSQFLQSQDHLLKQTFHDVREFSVQAPTMNIYEFMGRQIELQYQIALTQLQFNAGVYVAQSGKTGLQTLMKNQ